ncbi:MAG TPA: DNA replication/repair protein RecF [Acetobacteraceae bacterium]|nr:DNA replication/repair protein RecF [Acetobacteraceae bacterium]
MHAVERLTLTDFRSYTALTWRPEARISVITGANGSGKTNLLEAVSLLAPGRGLRGARIADLARHGGSGRWAVAARLHDADGVFDLGTGTLGDGPAERRQFRLDGAEPRNQAEIAARFAAVWLTPQMDGLFQEGASGRRRFLDRLVWALEPAHAREAAAHETAVASRNKLLAARGDPAWLAGLEESIARHAVALAASRRAFIAQLNAASLPGGAFPQAALGLADPIADRLGEEPALAVEAWLRGQLAERRVADAAAGATSIGAHRADLTIADAATGLPAARASTGQQKALLLGIILAHAALIAAARGTSPVLLLDEPAVHLDTTRREALFGALVALPGPVFVTGTDADIFVALRRDARFWQAGAGELRGGR